jgi:multidrug efflux pump subunit AcrB
VPSGFVPGQDKQYLVGFARQLPDGATLDRTEEVIRKMSDIALKTQPGVEQLGGVPGAVDQSGFTNSSNAGIVFARARSRSMNARTRRSPGTAIAAKRQSSNMAGIQEAFIAMFPPPPVATASARSAASSCSSRIAPASATRRWTTRPRRSWLRYPEDAGAGGRVLELSR